MSNFYPCIFFKAQWIQAYMGKNADGYQICQYELRVSILCCSFRCFEAITDLNVNSAFLANRHSHLTRNTVFDSVSAKLLCHINGFMSGFFCFINFPALCT
jgi:hypothetical protein